jgi:hypothetical protein
VQSEARKAEKLLQTQVFVRGRCVGKRATSYADMEKQPDFTEDHMHDMLKSQHRGMLDGIRDGKLNEMLGLDETQPIAIPVPARTAEPAAAAPVAAAPEAAPPEPPVAVPPTPEPAAPEVVAPAAAAGLAIQWANAEAVYAQSSVVMQFVVTENGSAVAGAQLTSRLNVANDAPIYSQAVTDASGRAEMKIFLDENALRDAAVLVQAKAGDRMATRKFVLRRNA